ncbi:Auxin-responsive family protein [Quillaja saponaria]|uniref:Auxin-responsive family protein n=1 Tax=Quillaja saponaria TaxID=32244 RepID=A0AAD7Q8M7_QUISA|nr:Auxin-responsive family protein [Quillaja saponaria]
MKLKLFARKIQRSLSRLSARRHYNLNDSNEEVGEVVPDDVREGHFAVFAVKGAEMKRFTVELHYLSNPAFLRLLEEAKEEYGFTQTGALAVPCLPGELQKILEGRSTT